MAEPSFRLLSVLLLHFVLFAAPVFGQVCSVGSSQDLNAAIRQCSDHGTRPASVVIQADAIVTQPEGSPGTILVPSNVNVRCEAGAVIRATNGNESVISVSNAANVLIEGCAIDGNKIAPHAISVSKGTNIHLSRLTLGGATSSLIFGVSWHHVEIEGSNFGNAAMGGWKPGNSGAVMLQGQSGASDHVRIHDNDCDGSLSHSSCFKVAGADTSQVQWVDVSHNFITVGDCNKIAGGCAGTPGGGEVGIELFSTTTADDTANIGFTIADNLVQAEDAATAANHAFCISIGGARGGSVTGNTVRDCQDFGIEIIGSYVSVSNNVLLDTGPISWDANFTNHADVIVSHNVIEHPFCRAAFVIASANHSLDAGTIDGNLVKGPMGPCGDGSSPAGIRIQGSDEGHIFNVRITNNTMEETATDTSAIEIFGSAQTQIEGNRFANVRGTGIALSRGTNFTIKNNYFNGGTFLVNSGSTIAQEAGNIVNGKIQ